MHRTTAIACCLAIWFLGRAAAAAEPESNFPLLYSDDFESGAERWEPTDPSAWRVEKIDESAVYSQFKKRSEYEPPHRSPYNLSLLRDLYVTDFDLHARVRSTHPDYGHRDVCLFLGHQDPAHFYYVHLGKKADDHANQIFIVDDAPRLKISLTSTDGTDWDDRWHHVRVSRRSELGTIEVYFDDMERPVMTAKDTRFRWGRVGLGSFDDTSAWDDIRLYGVAVERPQ